MLRRQLLQLKVVNTAVRGRVTVGDDEVRSYYAQTVRRVAGDQVQVRIQQIVIPVAKDAPPALVAKSAARPRKSSKVLAEARRLSTLCQKYCEDGAKGDGDTNLTPRGELAAELREVVATMDPTMCAVGSHRSAALRS